MTVEESGSHRVRTGWGWIMAAGIAFAFLGISLALQPLVAGLATGLLIAWALVIAGVFAVVAAIRNRGHGGTWIYGVLGVAAVLLGISLPPLAAALSLVWAIGFWLLLGGVVEVLGSLRLAGERMALILLGFLNVVLGIALLNAPPATALSFLAIAVGFSLFARGVGSIIFALKLRRLSKALG